MIRYQLGDSVVISDLITAIINPNARRWTSVGKSGIDEGHHIVQTCNSTYSPLEFHRGLETPQLAILRAAGSSLRPHWPPATA